MRSLSRVDLNLLVVFDAIYVEGGITRAAKRLNLTQPAISHALGRLRELFGDPLFERQGHGMAPTPVARAMVVPIREALTTIDSVVGDRGRFDPATSERRFVVGLRDVMEAVVLPRLTAGLLRVAPRVDLSSVRVNRAAVEQDLAIGRYDAIVDILMPMSAKVNHTLIASDGLVVVARRGHPCLDGGLTLDSYLAAKHVVVTSSEIGLGLADREVARFGHHRDIRLRCQQSYAACRVVSETDLVLTMPARYARIANLPFANEIVPAPFVKPSQDIYLYWHGNVDADPANRWLRDRLFDAFAETAAP